MSLKRHMIPEKVFIALAAGGGGATAIDLLRQAEYSKRLLLLRGIRDAAGEAHHPQAALTRRAYDLLAKTQESAPHAVEAALRYPTVGAWARRTLLVLTGRERGAAEPGELAAVAAAAAIRARFPCTIEVPVREGAVVLPSLGRAPLPGHDSAVVRSDADGAQLVAGGAARPLPADPHEDAPGWEALRRLEAEHRGVGARFLLDDHDPDRMPGGRLTTERLDDGELRHWRTALAAAWRLLVDRHDEVAEEVAGSISVLTPLAPQAQGLASATPAHAYGNVGLSRPPDAHFLAVALAHEVQHTKLTALLDVVPLTCPDDGVRYYAPWRDDPRPAAGLLQGVYAHLGIAAFWRTERHHVSGETAAEAERDFARWREAADLVLRTLRASGGLTREGERFAGEMSRTLRPWLDEPVSDEALRRARRATARHLSAWRRLNGDPPPIQGLGPDPGR